MVEHAALSPALLLSIGQTGGCPGEIRVKSVKANKLDFTLDEFTEEQRTALAGWYKHFTARYPVVGRLREYVPCLQLTKVTMPRRLHCLSMCIRVLQYDVVK